MALDLDAGFRQMLEVSVLSKTKVLCSLLVASVLVAGSAKADITKDFIGTWEVETKGKKEISTLRIWKQRNGTLRERATVRIPKVGIITVEIWNFRSGRSKSRTYRGRKQIETSTGSWRIKGNKIIVSTKTINFEDRFTYRSEGYLLRVSRNRWKTYREVTFSPPFDPADKEIVEARYLRVK